MTAPSVLSSIIAAMPDDDGRSIDDPTGSADAGARIDDSTVETLPPPEPRDIGQTEPIRPIEYLVLTNWRYERAIRDQVQEAVEKGQEEPQYISEEQHAPYDKLVELGELTLGFVSSSYEYKSDAVTIYKNKTYKWGRPCVVMVVATEGLPFSNEEKMLEYVKNIPVCPPRDGGGSYDWSVTRIIKEQAMDMTASHGWGELSESPKTVTCDRIRQWMTEFLEPRLDDEDWPETDDPTIQRLAFDKWIQSQQTVDLADSIQRWLAAGHNIELYKRLGRRRDRAAGAAKVEMLVDELVPAGMVTLLVGAREVGKSTIVTELAVAIATGRGDWLGRRINQERAQGLAVLITGEDGDAVVNGRLAYLDPDDQARRILVYALDGRPLVDILAEIKGIPDVSVISVDPARRYLHGDEDSSVNVDEFYAPLEETAHHTGAAVLVLHHPKKDANPTSLLQVRDAVRGSGVWLDRPRFALGCFRSKRDGVTVIGQIKNNLPPDHVMAREIRLRRDETTLRHIPVQQLEAAAEADDGGETDELDRKVLNAISRLTAQGERITRAGGRELWALRPPDLDGIGRNRIRETVDRLLDDGVLIVGVAGIEVAA